MKLDTVGADITPSSKSCKYFTRDDTKWIPRNSNVPDRFATRNVLRQSSGPTNFAKQNVNILFPHSKTHMGLTFDAPERAPSVVRGNGNPDVCVCVGLEYKAFSPNSGNIL
ncbi:hypothetical protein TNCV_1049911 [Trichonephila clavipes]|nr:hypothetical protein TNCV_1049911 [Trichonephila clavipes]